MKGSTVKIVWFSGLLAVLLIVAYGCIPVAESGATPASESASNANNVAAHFADYVFLHETRNESTLLQVAERANVCRGTILGAGS